jgi:hypothetical protein
MTDEQRRDRRKDRARAAQLNRLLATRRRQTRRPSAALPTPIATPTVLADHVPDVPQKVVALPTHDLAALERRVEERKRDRDEARALEERARATVAHLAASLASAERELREGEERVTATEERLAAAQRDLERASS